MSALYAMNFVGAQGFGIGAVYVGKGQVVGIDSGNARYHGSYTEGGGRLKGSISLTAGGPGVRLVTGQILPVGQSVQLTIDWPTNFATGQPQNVSVAGQPVQVTLEKIGDVP